MGLFLRCICLSLGIVVGFKGVFWLSCNGEAEEVLFFVPYKFSIVVVVVVEFDFFAVVENCCREGVFCRAGSLERVHTDLSSDVAR